MPGSLHGCPMLHKGKKGSDDDDDDYDDELRCYR